MTTRQGRPPKVDEREVRRMQATRRDLIIAIKEREARLNAHLAQVQFLRKGG